MEEDFFDVLMCREFAQLPEFTRLADKSTVLRVRLNQGDGSGLCRTSLSWNDLFLQLTTAP